MKNFTKSGFLYYELSQLQGKPAIIIYSDKETESKIFANDAVRREYMDSLSNILKEAGVTLYQVPYSAVWINPLTLLSVRTANSKLIVLEFPWGYSKQLKYPNIQLVKEVYDEIVKNLNPNGTADKYLTKAEAEDTYLSIADAEATYATNNSVDIKLDNKANLDDIPTNVSQLTNDAGYITGVPDNYVTDEKLAEKNYVSSTELAEKDYATNAAVTTALAAKADTSSLATVATSGSYNDLNDKPTIPAAYELPTASTSTLGGVKIDGTTIVINDGVISASNGGSGGTSNYAELTNKPTINNVELTGNKTSSDLNLTSNTNAVINNSLTLQEGDASLKVNFVETSDNKKVSEVQINGADYIDVLAQTHFLVAPTCGEQASYTDNEFMPKKSILSLIHMYSPKVHTDVVLTSSVKDDGDTTYPYLNTFNIADAEATDIPTVILSSDQVLSGNWSSISETVAGAVTIRTKVEIAEGTTIPQIILQKSTN